MSRLSVKSAASRSPRLPNQSKLKRSFKEDASGAQSVNRALGLLFLIGMRPASGFSLTEVISATGLNKATARRLLLALAKFGFVEQEAQSRKYFLGPETYYMGLLAEDRFGLQHIARESLRRLAAATGDSAFLSVRRGNDALCILFEEGEFPIRSAALRPGLRNPLSVGASSVAMLSELSDSDIERILGETAETIERDYRRLSPAIVRSMIRETRKSGFCLNKGLVTEGAWTIAVSIKDYAREANAAISISTIEARLGETRQQEVVRLLRKEALVIEKRLRDFKISLHGSFG